MKKFDYKKYRHIINIGVIALVAIMVLSWVGYSVLPEASDTARRELTHDEYSELTDEIIGEEGIRQDILLPAGTRLYGVNLNFHTYNRVVSGDVFLELEDENGNVIFTASDNMHNIKDNTFMGFIFEGYVVNEQDTPYTLHLYTQPQTSEDVIALWKSEETKEDFSFYQGTQEVSGTLALQFISSYSGDFVYTYYIVFAAAIFVLIMLAYVLIFIKKLKIEYVFLVLCVYIGVIFAFFTPVGGGADEYVHISSSYRNSSEILGTQALDQDGNLLVRASDEYNLSVPQNYDVFDMQFIHEGLFESGSGNEEFVAVPARPTEVFWPLHFMQTLGVTLARLLNMGFVPMIIFSRILNLLLYAALVFFAVRIMPFYKSTLALIGITPVPLQTAASFSYDTLVIGACFLFIAVCFKLIYKTERIGKKDITALLILAGLIAPSKAVYVVVLGLALLIPKAVFKDIRQNILVKGAVFLVGLVLWLGFNSALITTSVSSVVAQAENQAANQAAAAQAAESAETVLQTIDEADEAAVATQAQVQQPPLIEPNGDSRVYFSLTYIIKNIPATIKLVANTISEKAELYIYEIFGGKLGEVIVTPLSVSWVYVMAVIGILLASTIQKSGFELQFKGFNKLFVAAIILAVVGMIVLACITWTPSNYETIFGIQGRYFIPILPLVFFLLIGDNIRIKRSIDGVLLFGLAMVNMLILLDAFSIMALR